MKARFVCLECGAGFERRDRLERHWASDGHGPAQVAADALDRAVYALEGPESADARRARPMLRLVK